MRLSIQFLKLLLLIGGVIASHTVSARHCPGPNCPDSAPAHNCPGPGCVDPAPILHDASALTASDYKCPNKRCLNSAKTSSKKSSSDTINDGIKKTKKSKSPRSIDGSKSHLAK